MLYGVSSIDGWLCFLQTKLPRKGAILSKKINEAADW